MTHIKVEVYIPEDFVVELANELNEHDLLKEGYYDYAFSVSRVQGHWRPLEGANPYDGEIGVVSRAEEIKMEFRIPAQDKDLVQHIIDRVHPYEEPVVNYIALL
ncbi:MAG: hypothetical protein Q4E37_05495 [Tissierellia bacterium]|nr:hypothetical protein [Tissierellia bacterium]